MFIIFSGYRLLAHSILMMPMHIIACHSRLVCVFGKLSFQPVHPLGCHEVIINIISYY